MTAALTLVLTRRCDRACPYCPQEFREQDMSPGTLEAALDELAPRLDGRGRVRLFGGEPTLVPALVRRAIERVERRWPELRVELPTSGSRLAELEPLLSGRPRVEVFVSRPGPECERLPSVVVNLLLEPGLAAGTLASRVLELWKRGLRRLNLLPAYFVAWNAAQLAELRRGLAGLARLRRGAPFEVVNAARWGAVPLYGDGLCVDADGSVYASSLFLARRAAPYAASLRLGRVGGGPLSSLPLPRTLGALVERCWPADVVAGTLAADRALTEFVHGL